MKTNIFSLLLFFSSLFSFFFFLSIFFLFSLVYNLAIASLFLDMIVLFLCIFPGLCVYFRINWVFNFRLTACAKIGLAFNKDNTGAGIARDTTMNQKLMYTVRPNYDNQNYALLVNLFYLIFLIIKK